MDPKDPLKVKAGVASAAKRWGTRWPRRLRLTGLTEEQRQFVYEIVADLRAAAERQA